VERVQSAIAALGLRSAVIELAVDARTSQQAADALGVTVGQIAKSLVFTVNGRPLMVIASGANRVDMCTKPTSFAITFVQSPYGSTQACVAYQYGVHRTLTIASPGFFTSIRS